MFTGIVEGLGIIQEITREKDNLILSVSCSFVDELKIDQSIAHNGVCLTVTDVKNDYYNVCVVDETLKKSNLDLLNTGDILNLERSLKPTSRIDGHIVQGHVDQTATCVEKLNKNGSWCFTFEYDRSKKNLTVEKGSVCINGVSLTVVNSLPGKFSVVIIPYTFEHTNFKILKENSIVNIEFDILGKYVQEYLRQQKLSIT